MHKVLLSSCVLLLAVGCSSSGPPTNLSGTGSAGAGAGLGLGLADSSVVARGTDGECDARGDKVNCACMPAEDGQQRVCFSGNLADRGQNGCKDGVQTCTQTGSGEIKGYYWGPCTGQVAVCGTTHDGMGAGGGSTHDGMGVGGGSTHDGMGVGGGDTHDGTGETAGGTGSGGNGNTHDGTGATGGGIGSGSGGNGNTHDGTGATGGGIGSGGNGNTHDGTGATGGGIGSGRGGDGNTHDGTGETGGNMGEGRGGSGSPHEGRGGSGSPHEGRGGSGSPHEGRGGSRDSGDQCACPGIVRWCDDPVYCNWGKQTCLPDGTWGPCQEVSAGPAGCGTKPSGEPSFDQPCCERLGLCCAWSNDFLVGKCAANGCPSVSAGP